MDGVLLKNVGPGPGLTVIAFDPGNAALMGAWTSSSRSAPGSPKLSASVASALALGRHMVMDTTYELYYQDTLGAWHLTRFRPRPGKIECTFVGEVTTIPGEVEVQGTVAPP